MTRDAGKGAPAPGRPLAGAGPHRRPRFAPASAAGLLLAALLAGCGAERSEREGRETPEPAPSVLPGPHLPDPPDEADSAPAEGHYTDAGSLPRTRELEVTVEGMTESREATLFESPQGYAIYVLPQLTMTPEEPCCDLAYPPVDDSFFMRIERIGEHEDPATLRTNIERALSNVGEVEEVPPDRISARDFRDAELFLRAQGEGLSVYMFVAGIDGGRYRVTLHLPHREAIEGIAPSLWAMLGSLRTTGPRPEV